MELFDIYYDSTVGFQVLESSLRMTQEQQDKAKQRVLTDFEGKTTVSTDELENGIIGLLSLSNNGKMVTNFRVE